MRQWSGPENRPEGALAEKMQLTEHANTLWLDGTEWQSQLAAMPDLPGVYLLWPLTGPPHWGRTNLLRRRLSRLLAEDELGSVSPRSRLQLRRVLQRVEWWQTGSRLEASLLLHNLVCQYAAEDCWTALRLRRPWFVQLRMEQRFPLMRVSSRITEGTCYGPFATRAQAERFEQGLLHLFPLRRCTEELAPSLSHPGCVYGEMNMCRRPCQLAITPEEYRAEARQTQEFLVTQGDVTQEHLSRQREQASERLDFEAAARLHQRHEQIRQLLSEAGPLARGLEELQGLAVLPSSRTDSIVLWPLQQGIWLQPHSLAPAEIGSLQQDALWQASPEPVSADRREQHLALLARWFYSTWRDGEWIACEQNTPVSVRRLRAAAQRVLGAQAPTKSELAIH